MLRANHRRAKNARLIFLLLLLVTGSTALLSLLGLSLPNWVEVTMTIAPSLTKGIYYTYALLMLGQLGATVASYVFLIMWLRRAYYNLHQLPGIHPEYSDGWAAGAWFVPFLNLVRPYTIMREVWVDTQRAAVGQVVRPPTVLGWWWAFFVLKMIVGRLTSQVSSNDNVLSHDDLLLTLCGSTVCCVAAAFTWYVIGQAAGFEEQLVLRQQINQLGQPAPAAPLAELPDQPDYALEEY